MGKYQKKLFSRVQKLKWQLQHESKDFFPSRSKFLPDIPAAASELDRTRRWAALSPEVSPKWKIICHKEEATDVLVGLQFAAKGVLAQTQTKVILSSRAY